jgi:hypothetical protein
MTCPKVGTCDSLLFLHNIILKELGRYRCWMIPLPWTWRMPHTLNPNQEKYQILFTPLVLEMIERGVFGDPIPRKGDKPI